jgi:SAM-dependent methyltransferase
VRTRRGGRSEACASLRLPWVSTGHEARYFAACEREFSEPSCGPLPAWLAVMTAVAGADYWDSFLQGLRESGGDLDWEGRWIEPFLAPLRDAGVQTILELGCGTVNDAARLADDGYAHTALDVSREATEQAQSRLGSPVNFLVADATLPLPFPAVPSMGDVQRGVAYVLDASRVRSPLRSEE